MNLRPAYITDALRLAELIDLSNEGMSSCIWQHLSEAEESPLEAGSRLIAGEDGVFSYRHATVIAEGKQVVAMASARHLQLRPVPLVPDELQPFIRAIMRLEQRCFGSWHIAALAVDPDMRRQGLATQLLMAMEEIALQMDIHQLSMIVASENHAAVALAEKSGYRKIASEKVVRCGVMRHNGDWLLMFKDI